MTASELRFSDWSSDVCSSDLLTAFLDARLTRRLAEIDYRPPLGIDGALKALGATLELLAQLERCGPFGVGNTQPRFALPAVRVAKASVVGDNHVRCFLGDGPGGSGGGGSIKAIAFRALESDLGPALLQTAGRRSEEHTSELQSQMRSSN